jgi:predicted unusual protein kinase regulating ubiquinone biosynthesis (AarF/ABC1/UbiB family)
MDDNPLTTRMKRYAQVTSAMSGLAARLAGEKYLGITINPDTHAQSLKETLGSLKGPLMKAAQILAMVPDMLPEEYAQELSQLQSNAPSMGAFFVRRRMATELGAQWRSHFSAFDEIAAAAASLGQVHKATLASTGNQVACKLQYPDMSSIVQADLEQLKFLLSTYERFNNALHTQNMLDEIAERLYEELDYVREAKHIQIYQHIMKPYDFVNVPQVYPELSTDRLLTMSWLEGEKLTNCLEKGEEWRSQVAERLFNAWYMPFYHYGVLHADPHMGNYTLTPNGHINLLDFGCIRIFPSTFVAGVIDLYTALKNNDMALAHHAYTQWGFQNLTKELIDTLNLWAKFLYAPLLDDRVRPIQEGHSGLLGKEVADSTHRKIKELGGITPPREFVFMDRAAVGIGSALMHLRVEKNWHTLFESLIDGFKAENIASRQKNLNDQPPAKK